MQESNLYLLRFKNKDYFKIGKANNISKRFVHFKEFGEIDWCNSYVFPFDSEKKALGVERCLHLINSEARFSFNSGDGKTEFFENKCLKYSLEVLASIFQREDLSELLFKGKIIEPASRRQHKEKDLWKTRSLNRILRFLHALQKVENCRFDLHTSSSILIKLSCRSKARYDRISKALHNECEYKIFKLKFGKYESDGSLLCEIHHRQITKKKGEFDLKFNFVESAKMAKEFLKTIKPLDILKHYDLEFYKKICTQSYST